MGNKKGGSLGRLIHIALCFALSLCILLGSVFCAAACVTSLSNSLKNAFLGETSEDESSSPDDSSSSSTGDSPVAFYYLLAAVFVSALISLAIIFRKNKSSGRD